MGKENKSNLPLLDPCKSDVDNLTCHRNENLYILQVKRLLTIFRVSFSLSNVVFGQKRNSDMTALVDTSG